MQFAATYPLAQIRRVQIYNNIKRYRETERCLSLIHI